MAQHLSSEVVSPLIIALLPRGYPGIEEVAGLLHVSQRTLQRQLHTEGVSYSELVERCRYQAACNYLQQTQDAVADIAERLAYADPSSFSRAFRRWSGITPRAFRSKSWAKPDVTNQDINSFNMHH
jgi:AraC-like DNA-binding protein